MASLKYFSSVGEKEKFFSNKEDTMINTKADFDDWFSFYTSEIKAERRTDFIFRGMKDARHRLYTSAQRRWIENDMKEWVNDGFIGFIDRMIQNAKTEPLLKKVFDIYDYDDAKREFPLMSILQHYGAPTPLMDWTYNINVALFFATENLSGGNGSNDLKDYFSIYRIDKKKYVKELLNFPDFAGSRSTKIIDFKDWGDDITNLNRNSIFYISDFETGNARINPHNTIILRNDQPLTSIYNQNIIPQEGLFIFNPFSEKPMEDIFNVNLDNDGWNLRLTPFSCFNIKKDLADYVRRRIKNHEDIDRAFIYPHLYDDAKAITNTTLNSYAI